MTEKEKMHSGDLYLCGDKEYYFKDRKIDYSKI